MGEIAACPSQRVHQEMPHALVPNHAEIERHFGWEGFRILAQQLTVSHHLGGGLILLPRTMSCDGNVKTQVVSHTRARQHALLPCQSPP